jgi:hypothetical protein
MHAPALPQDIFEEYGRLQHNTVVHCKQVNRGDLGVGQQQQA